MIKEKMTIQNKLGLHTRAAAKFVDLAKRYGSRIELIYRDRTVDGKSIMGVITLGAKLDSELDVAIEGEDEHEAFHAIKKLLDQKFGED